MVIENKVSVIANSLEGRRIMVVGLSKTGISLIKFLVSRKAKVTVSDHKSAAELSDYLEQVEDLDIHYDLGGHTPKAMLNQELIILSPGIPSELKIFEYVKQNGVTITGDIEFTCHFIKEPIIAITGTNGKTTVSNIAYKMLKRSGVDVWIGGNFGRPLVEYLLEDRKYKVIICEISSFQLEHVVSFSPKVIVFTNISENHLDRHKSFEDYSKAKKRIFLNANKDMTSVLNADDSRIVNMARDPIVQKGRIFYFSRRKGLESQIMNIGGSTCINKEISLRVGPETEKYSVKRVKCRGVHSIENIMAALCAVREFGAKPEVIQDVIDNFVGLPHRIEYVGKASGVDFYNDSKATNIHAVHRALSSFDEGVVLIAGGKDANVHFSGLSEIIRKKVKMLILFGEAKEKINRSIGDCSETFLVGTFEEAVYQAYQRSSMGDVVLLSPGCPSFDLFDSYIERGNYFKKLIKNYKSQTFDRR